AALTDQGPTRGTQNVFVNRRIVKDKTIAHAVIEAYSSAQIKERSPEVHLFLEIPADRVDVNVHPTKAEVRFRDQSFIHEAVKHAVADAIGRGAVPELQLVANAASDRIPSVQSIPGVLAGPSFPSRWTPPSLASADQIQSAISAGASRDEISAEADSPVKPMMPLGQFRDTFIIAVDADGIAIIDQHVAHERVLFERVMQRLSTGPLESQRLLVPIVLELAPAAHATLVARSPELAQLGFAVESFGEKAINVTAVPALLNAAECATTLQALAD